MKCKVVQQVLNAYRPLIQELDISKCEEVGKTIAIPTFDEQVILELCAEAKRHLQRMDIVLELRAPIYIVGDIHGNIFDLIRILVSANPPPKSRMLFLGDYVDRGEYSIEVVTLLFALMCAYPDCVYLLRGNHEFESMNSTYGFLSEVTTQYNSKQLYETINEVFQYMPLIATLNNTIFCVHGGISPTLTSLDQIRKIRRPLPSYDVEFVSDLMWSDPCYKCKTYDESNRGLGVQFGVKALKDFLDTMKMKQMFRAHQCVMQGVLKFGEDMLYTVFSCSNYADSKGNRCGLLFVQPSLQIQMFALPAIEQIPRQSALVNRINVNDDFEMQANDSLALNVKLFDISMSQQRSYSSKVSMFSRSRDNILNKFSNSNSNIRPVKQVKRQPVGPTKLPPLNRFNSEDPQSSKQIRALI